MQKPFILNNNLLYFFLAVVIFSCTKIGSNDKNDKPLFKLLTPETTNVGFQNTLTEGPNTNILIYEYFYNGGGVAAADFNGDGLDDLYFTANMSENKMYLNKGGFKFQDITHLAGVDGRPGPWKTGVSVVDINADGLLDIYLCYSGMMPPEKRVNQLFINQGNNASGVPHFIEQAFQYGLASTGFSNQAYFFDADLDDDLDMLLLNHNPKNLPILNVAATKELMATNDSDMGLRFFRQDNGYFTDQTQKAGINGSPLSYGLGLGITDFNADGWPDFYVSNDYLVPDYLYINNRNGTFSNSLQQSLGHTSEFSMGNDVADINNDGWTDIFTLDMLPEDNRRQKLLLSPDNFNKFDLTVQSGFYYQYMRNMLHLNNGNNTFSEVGQQFGVSNTDWSWSALLADYDNDGWKDLFVSNGYLHDYTNQDFVKYMDDYVQARGRLSKDDVLEIIKNMPASDVVNYMFQNGKGKGFTNKTKAWGLAEASNSSGAAYSDLDNDGDLDLVVNNINKAAFIYRNESKSNYLNISLKGSEKNPQGIGAAVEIRCGETTQRIEQNPMRGYLSAVSYKLHFGLGKYQNIDSLSVYWPDGKMQKIANLSVNRTLILDYKNATSEKKQRPSEMPIFKPVNSPISDEQEYREIRDYDRQPLLVQELSFTGPCLAAGDLNADGLEDIFMGSEPGHSAKIFLQKAKGQFIESKQNAFVEDAACMDAAALFHDFNADGFVDLYVCSGGYHDYQPEDRRLHDRIYINDGKGNLVKKSLLPEMLTATAAVAASDINRDGLPDLFIGGRCVPGRYPEIPRSYILIQEKSGRFVDKTLDIAPELGHFGMITAANWADLDQDKAPELVLAGEWLPISVFKNMGGKLRNVSKDFFDIPRIGWWNCLKIKDINADGKADILAGNMGLNTQFKVSEKEPLELYSADFDKNGSVDPILNFYIQGQSYPYLTRDELLSQLPKFKAQFNAFEPYATAKLSDLFSEQDLKEAAHLKADFMQTAVFLSGSTRQYRLASLPIEVQYAPVYVIEIQDFNADGAEDIFMAGNNSHTKLRFGKFDASYGQLLLGNGKGNFSYMPQTKSGFSIRGDVRAALWLNNCLILGLNSAAYKAYRPTVLP